MPKIIIIVTFFFAITLVVAIERLPDQPTKIVGGYRECDTYRYYYYNYKGRIEPPTIRKISRSDYDENGFLECVNVLDDEGKAYSLYKHKFDKFGNETFHESSDVLGKVYYRDVYLRDDKGRVIEFIHYNNKLDTIRRWITKYIDDGMTILYHNYKKHSGDTLKTLSIYDDNGNCIEEIRYYNIDSIISKNIYRYNKDGLKIEYSEFLPDHGEIIREQYEYNKYSQLIVKIIYDERSTITDLWKKEFYDQNGKLIECIWYTNNEPNSRSIKNYDNYGNKIKEIFYHNRNQIYDKIIYEYSK
ncbi:MAG: hypothetical protein WCR42_14855 [bacterium]